MEKPHYKLRPYQQRVLDQILEQTNKNSKPFIVSLATGAGKSLLISETAKALGGRTLILQPNVELLRQNADKINTWCNAKVYSASAGEKSLGVITLGTLGSVIKERAFECYDVLILDEVDCGYQIEKPSSQFMKFVNQCDFKHIIGFTATPYRLRSRLDRRTMTAKTQVMMLNRIPTKGKGNNRFGTFFWGPIVGKVEMAELIEQGYLVRPKYYVENYKTELLRINKAGNEYTMESLEAYGSAVVDRLTSVVEGVLASDRHKKVLVFVPSVKNAQALRGELSEYTTGVVLGDTKKKEREQVVKDFKAGKIQVLINVNCLTMGFDVPDLDAIVIGRGTLSPRLYMQMIGRVVRIADGKDKACVYDITGTVKRFGPAESITLGKEGYKDALYCENGRLDMRTLAEYRVM